MRIRYLRWLAARASLCLLFLPFTVLCQSPAPKSAKPAGQSSQWIRHEEPQLYSVESPPGWTVSPDKQKGWVHLTGTQGEDIVIWPVFIPGAVDQRFAPLIFARLAASSPYKAQWETTQAVTANVLRARGTRGDAVAISAFTWVSSPKGLAGFFYVVAAREPEYRQRQNDFARILQSFCVIGAAVGASTEGPGGVRYVKFTDPKEGAFTIDVPAGWKTEGGLFRFHALDIRTAVAAISPDGQMRIFVGDVDFLGPFIDPSGTFSPEGSVYAPYGLKMRVLRFPHGAVLCREYVSSKISQVCPNPQIAEVKDLSGQIPKLVAEHPNSTGVGDNRNSALAHTSRATWADVSFRCGEPAQPKTGHCQAITDAFGPPLWRVHNLSAFVAPAEKESLANSIWDHTRESLQFEPQWEHMETQLAGAASRAVSGTANDIANMMARSQMARNAIDDEIARRRSNATLGVVDLADPETGRHMSVESGSNYYWVDPRGVIVGTTTDTHPSVDFRALLQLL